MIRRQVLSALSISTLGLGCSSLFGLRPASGLDVMKPDDDVRARALALTRGRTSDKEKALALYTFVRDEIRFGFTKAFDFATPSETLASGLGHCNPKGTLLAAMLNAVGIGARIHFYTIGNDVLRGVFSVGTPARLSHAVVEVKLGDDFVPIDGHVADEPLFLAARARLQREGRTLGYGAHRDGSVAWDGETPCFSQLADEKTMAIADLGTFTDPALLYASDDYAQRMSLLGGIGYRLAGIDDANRNLDALRRGSG